MADPKITEKRWSKDFEKEVTEEWKNNPHKFDKNTSKKVYSIDLTSSTRTLQRKYTA
jgi:hypothetical protein